ncbi:MAG: phage holin family protein [Candidatus Magasanikbacteria bacterium]|nr:phage holin family protein [Candidatus Magasanikbacteria bacterium]
MKLFIRWLLSAAALVLLAYYIPGISIANFYAAIVAALVLGLINALIKPIIVVLTLPFNILTLGLFSLLINTFCFWFASTVVKGFGVAGFWPAFWGAFAMWVFNWFVGSLLKGR